MENGSLPVRILCETFDLARSSYYAGLRALKRAQDKGFHDRALWVRIGEIWEMFPGLGCKKLARYMGVGKDRIGAVIARYYNPVKKRRPKKKRAANKRRNILRNITEAFINSPQKALRGNWVIRDGKNKYRKVIEPTRPYQLWTGDWKELKIPILDITAYIFIIIDAYTRQIKGYHISLIKDTCSALKAAKMAITNSCKDRLFQPDKLIMHTDQGSAYISKEYDTYWRSYKVKLSYAAPGKPTQNPYSEGIISILSRFCLSHYEFSSVVELDDVVSNFVKDYNHNWWHEHLGDISPNQRLENYRQTSLISSN
jgi:transposase InsO family protein